MEWGPVYIAVTWLRNNWAKVRPWITPLALASETKPIPKKTFRIVLDTSVPPWWHMGKMGDEPATQIHARYYVTNTVDEKMLVVGCKLELEGMDQAYGVQHSTQQVRNNGENTPTILVSVVGFIHPPIVMDDDKFEGRVIFIDQFGNEISGPVTTFTKKRSRSGGN